VTEGRQAEEESGNREEDMDPPLLNKKGTRTLNCFGIMEKAKHRGGNFPSLSLDAFAVTTSGPKRSPWGR